MVSTPDPPVRVEPTGHPYPPRPTITGATVVAGAGVVAVVGFGNF